MLLSTRSKAWGIAAVGAALAIALGATLLREKSARGEPPALPAHPERLEPELAERIDASLRAVRARPADARAHAELGLAYELARLWSEARASYASAARLDPSEPMWPCHEAIALQEAGDAPAALELLRRAAPRFPDSLALQCRLGTLALDDGDFAGAAEAFERAIAAHPRSSEAHAGLGDALLRQGDAQAALGPLNRALELDPSYALPQFLVGTALQRLGRDGEAAWVLRLGAGAVQRIPPDAWSARLSELDPAQALERARALLAGGRAAEAAKVLEPFAVRSRDPRLLANLALAKEATGEPQHARQLLEQAERAAPHDARLPLAVSALELRLGDSAAALAAAERSRELSPRLAAAELARARALLALGEPERAFAALDAARRLDPASAEVETASAEACIAIGRLDLARRHFERLCELLPGRWQPWADLYQVCLDLGDVEGARAALQAARRLAPGEPRLAELARAFEAGGER
jgi:tetratricopeptide (TPR) repeat protein